MFSNHRVPGTKGKKAACENTGLAEVNCGEGGSLHELKKSFSKIKWQFLLVVSGGTEVPMISVQISH